MTAAQKFAQRGGKSKSAAKQKAAKANGKLGGRPKATAASTLKAFCRKINTVDWLNLNAAEKAAWIMALEPVDALIDLLTKKDA